MEHVDMDRYIRRIRREYADTYGEMRWLSAGAAGAAGRIRESMVREIFDRYAEKAGWQFEGTKLFTHDLSPGCRLCGQGKWSCLFINGVCNASCFYCPSAQKDFGPPVTSSVEFDCARDYADYVDQFDIQGVGFSGGEPLMTFDRVVDYLQALRDSVSRPLHTWMYTNGLLVTEDKLKTLRDKGLMEIRFDLSANNYRLDSLKKAVGIIPVVTVEMPAIPEDLERTKSLLSELHSEGVNFLNLHQIRCTHFNKAQLMQRGYTFLHGTGVSILETEFAALELISHALQNKIDLPVNYCSFTFRDQFQKAGARSRNAAKVREPWEDITRTGFLRTITLQGAPREICRVRDGLNSRGSKGITRHVEEREASLSFPAACWPEVDFTGLKVKINYNATALRSAASFRYPFTEISLNEDKTVVIERDNRHPGIQLKGDEIRCYAAEYLGFDKENFKETGTQLSPEIKKELDRFESFSCGLASYF